MDTRITKERLDKHLEYDWFKYIAILIAAIFIWWGVYSIVDNPKGYERIDFFVYTNSYTDENGEPSGLKQAIWTALEAEEDQTIRTISVVYFSTIAQLQTTALSCDLFIAEREYVENFYALPLTEEVLALANLDAAGLDFYFAEEESDPRAIKLNSNALKTWLPATIAGEEGDIEQTYYVGIIARNTMGGDNIGEFNSKNKQHSQAFTALAATVNRF